MFHGWTTIVAILVVIHVVAIGYWAWLLNIAGHQKPKRKKILSHEHRITYDMDPKRTRANSRLTSMDV